MDVVVFYDCAINGYDGSTFSKVDHLVRNAD